MTAGDADATDGLLMTVTAERAVDENETAVELGGRRGRINADLTIGAGSVSIRSAASE